MLNCCISIRSEHQILSMPFTITLCRVKLRFIGLCNSSSNCCCQFSSLDGFFSFLKHQVRVSVFFINQKSSCFAPFRHFSIRNHIQLFYHGSVTVTFVFAHIITNIMASGYFIHFIVRLNTPF